LKKKVLSLLALTALIVFLAIGGLAYNGSTTSSTPDISLFASCLVIHAGDWGCTLTSPDFPRTGYNDMGKGSLKLFRVNTPNGLKPIMEISTGSYPLWDDEASFSIVGKSLYEDFPEQKFVVKHLKDDYTPLFDRTLDFYFPSEDRKIFKIQVELDTQYLSKEFKILSIDFVDDAAKNQFLEDLTLLKDNGKVPVGGVTTGIYISKVEQGTTALGTFDSATASVKATLGEDADFSITSKKVTTGKPLFAVKGDCPVDASTAATAYVAKTDSPTAEQKLAILKDKFAPVEAGSKLSICQYDGSAVSKDSITIYPKGSSSDCDACDTILKCLACIDKAFVDNVFESE